MTMKTSPVAESEKSGGKLFMLFSLFLLLLWGNIISGRRGSGSGSGSGSRGDHYESDMSSTQHPRKIHHDFCPVSGDLNITRNHLFKYPIDIYNFSLSHHMVHGKPYSCSARRVHTYSQHQCPDDVADDVHAAMLNEKAYCPVNEQQLHLSLNATSWPVYNSRNMIHLLDKIFKSNSLSSKGSEHHEASTTSERVRVLFLGGSVTAGHETGGYCCSHSHTNSEQRHLLDSRCDAANDCGKYFEKALPHMNHDDSGVSWVKYFGRALAQGSQVPLEVYSLAAPGTTSNYMASHISGILKKLPPPRENTSDIIFVDYSYNDGRVFQGPKRSMLDQAIESLVRNVLTAYPATSRPFLVLLESYVHSHGVFGRKCDTSTTTASESRGDGNGHTSSCSSEVDDEISEQSTDYSFAYRRIAKHYGLQVWSARNVYWDLFHQGRHPEKSGAGVSTASAASSTASSFLNAMIQGHPPWHTHLFWADLYLSVMQHSLREHLAALDSASPQSQSQSRAGHPGEAFLPPPLVKAEDISSQQCDWQSPLFAELAFDFHGNIHPTAHYFALPPGSWLFDKDGGDKPGWMTQRSSSNHTLVVPLNTSHLLRWIEGKTKQERLDRLDDRDIVIVLSYLKSYEKMFTVSLELCGHIITTESALWSDRFSLSYTSVLPIGHFIEKHCDEVLLQLEAEARQPSSRAQPSTVAVHLHSPAPHLVNTGEEEGKFKLLGLTVCETDTGGAPFFSAQTLIS